MSKLMDNIRNEAQQMALSKRSLDNIPYKYVRIAMESIKNQKSMTLAMQILDFNMEMPAHKQARFDALIDEIRNIDVQQYVEAAFTKAMIVDVDFISKLSDEGFFNRLLDKTGMKMQEQLKGVINKITHLRDAE